MVPMPVALRRFRTTVATAITGTARRELRPLWGPASLAAGLAVGLTAGLTVGLAAAVFTCRATNAGDAAAPPPAARRLLAAGEVAAERGWLATARDHWQAAAKAAERDGDSATRVQAVTHMTRLDTVAREAEADQLRDANRDDAVSSATDWRPAWRMAAAGWSAAAGPPTVGGGLVAWSDGRAVHAVAFADGTAAWPVGAPDDTLVFPRDVTSFAGIGRGPDAFSGAPSPVVLATSGRGFVVLDRGRDGDRLVCLDLSDRAQGRLAWSTRAADLPRAASPAAPRSRATFAGPPAVDDDLCAIVLQTDDGRGSLTLAVYDARDGSLRWSHDLGPSGAEEGIDGPRHCRRPCLAEDRIVVDTLAGTVRAFDRDGAAIWKAVTPPMANGSGASRCVPSSIFAAGRLMCCAADGSAISAIEPRHGGPIWRWQADDARVVAMLGTADAGLLIATRREADGAGATTLRRLSLDDGRQTAAWTVDGTAVGRGTLADGTVFWPVGSSTPSGDDTLLVEMLDAGTLERRRPPLDCGPAPRAVRSVPPGDHAEPTLRLTVANGSIVLADDALTCLRPASDHSPDAPSR
jgi:outer membrane protein assembly factor BamB